MTQAAPRIGLRRFRTRVVAVERPSPSLVLADLERPADYEFQAGQFLYVFLRDANERRAYSIASPPHERDRLSLCVKRVEGGPLSSWIYEWQVGQEVEVSRALGGFVFKSPPGTPVVFLATGTGAAPLRSMYLDRLHQGDPREMAFYLGSREAHNLPYHEESLRLAREHANFRYVPVLSGGGMEWQGERGWIQEPFGRHFQGRRDYEAYVCGVKRMVDDVSFALREHGVSPKAIHLERYV